MEYKISDVLTYFVIMFKATDRALLLFYNVEECCVCVYHLRNIPWERKHTTIEVVGETEMLSLPFTQRCVQLAGFGQK